MSIREIQDFAQKVTPDDTDKILIQDVSGTTQYVEAGNLQDKYHGWIQVSDNTYTVGSPKAITGGVRTKLDISADSVIESQAPVGTTAATFWDNTNKKMLTENSGDAYIVRLNATIDPATTNTYFTLELDIGGSQGAILSRTQSLSKGSAIDTYSTTNLIYALGTFAANGGEFYITPNNNIDIYDMSLVIARTHRAK